MGLRGVSIGILTDRLASDLSRLELEKVVAAMVEFGLVYNTTDIEHVDVEEDDDPEDILAKALSDYGSNYDVEKQGSNRAAPADTGATDALHTAWLLLLVRYRASACATS